MPPPVEAWNLEPTEAFEEVAVAWQNPIHDHGVDWTVESGQITESPLCFAEVERSGEGSIPHEPTISSRWVGSSRNHPGWLQTPHPLAVDAWAKTENPEPRSIAMITTPTASQTPNTEPVAGAPPSERTVADLEAELDRVKADRSVEQERLDRRSQWRRFFSTTLAIVAALSIVFSVTGIWLRTTVLDSERFAAAAAPLTKNDDVARAISEFAAAEIVTHTNAQQEIQQFLPTDAQVLAGPIASGLEDGLAEVVDDVVQTDEFQAVFETAIRVSHEEALLILDGDGDVIESKDGQVTINLLIVVNDVIQAAASDLSAVLGTNITVPTISPDDVPADQIAELESALGVQLPADFGHVTLFQSDELAEAQTWVNRFDTWLEVIISRRDRCHHRSVRPGLRSATDRHHARPRGAGCHGADLAPDRRHGGRVFQARRRSHGQGRGASGHRHHVLRPRPGGMVDDWICPSSGLSSQC